MKEVTIKLTEEECKAFATLVKEYKEIDGVCDASKARLLGKMSEKGLI